MKLAPIFENEDKYLYHATFTKNVDRIKEKGLLQFEPSNWVRGNKDGSRYNEDAGIFAFTHPEDAVRWGMKMEWDMGPGDGKPQPDISIVRIALGDYWGDDPAEDPILAMTGKGKARRSTQNVKAEEIIDSFRLDDFGRAGEMNISIDDWFERVTKKLRS